jgi:hypothetical protein
VDNPDISWHCCLLLRLLMPNSIFYTHPSNVKQNELENSLKIVGNNLIIRHIDKRR